MSRAPLNSKTAISVDKNALAMQIAGNLRARGVAVRRLFGPLSVEGAGACKIPEAAQSFVTGGQSLRLEFCEGRHRARCPHYAGCTARLGADGPASARVTVGPHQMLAQLDEAAGRTGLLIIDEPPPILESVVLDVHEMETAARHADSFRRAYATPLVRALRDLRAWSNGGREPDMARLRALCPPHPLPPVHWHHVVRAREQPAFAKGIGVASRVFRHLARALRGDGATIDVHKGTLLLGVVNEVLAAALRREGRVVAMAADVELAVPLYTRVVGYTPPVHRVAVADGAPVARTLFRVRATRSAWCRGGEPPPSFCAAVRRVLAWAEGRALGIVTFGALEKHVRAIADLDGYSGILRIAHYGALRGLDHWSDLDALATLGDPRPNLGHVAREAEYAGVDMEPRVISLARAELEQAHGRLRTVHRSRSAIASHTGEVWPGGSGWALDRVRVVDVLGGPPRGRTGGLGASSGWGGVP